MSNARKLADNLPSEGHFGNRNFVINGNFTVSQRGNYTSSTSVSDGTFYLDRWQYVEDGSPSSSLIHNSDGSVKITTGASVTGSSRLRQKFEYALTPRQYDGKTFTVSAKVKSNTANARINVYAGGYLSLTGTTAHSGGGSYETLTATFTTPSTISTEFSLHIGIDGASSANVSITSGQYFEVKEVQMEEGSKHTPFEHEPISITENKCKRYYNVYGRSTGSNQGSSAHCAWVYSSTGGSVRIPSVGGPQMRVRPSLTLVGTPTGPTGVGAGGTMGVYTSNSWQSAGGNTWYATDASLDPSFRIDYNTSGGLNTNGTCGLYFYCSSMYPTDSSFAGVILDAEL